MVEILSVHIPKTAGTAFWRVLTQVYNADDIYHDMGAKSCEPTDSFLQKITVIHTHYSLKKYQGYFPNAKKIVWLR
nr:hypothetical protein [Xenococcaceae cyanobacterium MO_167.B52]